MKQTISILILALLIVACKGKKHEQAEKTGDTEIEWTQKNFDFGTISEGETVVHTFRFRNIGQHNFVIKGTESGCGCTTVNYDGTPVQAGKEGKLEIAFNSSGRSGKQYKEISIFANVPAKKITLIITADVR